MMRPRFGRTVSRSDMLRSSTLTPAVLSASANWLRRQRQGAVLVTRPASRCAFVNAQPWSVSTVVSRPVPDLIRGRLWRSSGTCARSCQGFVPSDVRHACADGGSVGAAVELRPTWFHAGYRRCACPAGKHGERSVCDGAQTAHRCSIVAEVKHCGRPDGVSAPKHYQSRPANFTLDVVLEFCKRFHGSLSRWLARPPGLRRSGCARRRGEPSSLG